MTKPQRTRRIGWLTLVQGLVSLCLLFWVVRQVSWVELAHNLSIASPSLIVLTCLLYYIGIVLSCCKWQSILKIEGVSVPLFRLLRWYLIGSFANNFLPTDVGGDLGRGFYASRSIGQSALIARSILVERLTGLAVMLMLAWIGLIIIAHQVIIALLLAGAGILVSLMVWLLFVGVANRLPERLQAILELWRSIWQQYRLQPARIGWILIASLIFQLMAGFGAWVNFRAVGMSLPLSTMLLVFAMASVLGLLPISVNGWGVKESVYIGLLTPVIASPGNILAGVLLGRALAFLLSLAGVIPLMIEKKSLPDSISN
jgi:glycosyltransferase 2 family protein